MKHPALPIFLSWVSGILVASLPALAEPPATLRGELAVIGGGSGGFGAALAAARAGVEVVLVEQADCLGGNSVCAGVSCWEMGAGGTGIPFDLYLRLKAIPSAVGIYSYGRHMVWFDPRNDGQRFPGGETRIDPARHYRDTLQRCGLRGLAADGDLCRERWHGVPFEPEAMARVMLAMLEETGHCRVVFGAAAQGVQADGGRVRAVVLADGRRVEADYFIDATGDGTVCVAAGCAWMAGQDASSRFGEPSAPPEATSRLNGVTLIYRVTPAEPERIEPLPPDVPERCWWADQFPVAQFNQYPCGDWNVNMLPTLDGAEFARLGYDAALAECRRRVLAHWHDLQTRFPEFRRARLAWIAPALGIRETRRIVGEYVLTENDLRTGISRQQHPDIVCLADHPMDTHGGHARGIGELAEPYGVPYRCLIPKGQRNLLVACRAASFSSLAASSCRLSRTMMQLGQAAGTAVALARAQGVDLPEVPPEELRGALRLQHVQLEYPMPPELREHLAESE